MIKKQSDDIKTNKIKIDAKKHQKARCGLRVMYNGIILENITKLEIEYIKDDRIKDNGQMDKLLSDIDEK